MSTTILEKKPGQRPSASAQAETRLSVVDCDIHPATKSPRELFPYLSKRWQEYVLSYGSNIRQGLADALMHPRMTPDVARLDAWPPDGSTPGSDP